jgi:hypothetical protein
MPKTLHQQRENALQSMIEDEEGWILDVSGAVEKIETSLLELIEQAKTTKQPCLGMNLKPMNPQDCFWEVVQDGDKKAIEEYHSNHLTLLKSPIEPTSEMGSVVA